MDILVNVANQKLKIATNLKSLVSGTQEFVRFVFNLTDDWTGLTTFAQFMQNGVAYNQFLDEENSAYLPAEIEEGTCTVMLYGSNDNVIATTNYLTLAIDANILVEDAESTDISQSLYNQLITRINAIAGSSESDFADLQATDRSLQQQVNTKAAQTALTAEIARAQAAEQTNAANIALKANQAEMDTRLAAITNWNTTNKQNLEAVDTDLQNQINTKAAATALEAEIQRATRVETEHTNALLLKANQSQVDELDLKVTALENNEYIATLIGDAVAAEMEEYLESGALASLAILDGTVTRAKLNTDVETVLVKAEGAMQKSVYDPQNLGVDVFSYAQARADTVQRNLNTVISEIAASYQLTDTLVYTNLKDTIQGTLTLARNYAQALLADYKAFTITIVDELPATGQAQTFYLVPNNSNTGYDKYWWIIDDNNVAKWDVFGSSSTLVVTELPETGDEDVDYILKSAHGCIYYKYIDNDWQVVAGSLAYVAAALPSVAQGNEFTDYYVISQESGNYIHYRFINGAYHVIGGDTYDRDSIDSLLNAMDSNLGNRISANTQNIATANTNISSLNQTVNSLQQELSNLDVEGVTYFATYGTATLASGEEKQNVFTLWEVEDGVESVKSQFVIQGGGGGGQQTITNLVVDRITQSPLIITPNDKALIAIDFSSTDSDGEIVDGSYTWKNGNTTIMTGTLVQGVNTFDLTDYVSIGTQKFTLTVVDEGGSTMVKTWTVQVVDVRLESSFSDRITYPVGQSVNFSYTPYGSIAKTIHFILDGEELTSVNTSASGTLQSYTLSSQQHGAHLLECFATASINGITVETEHIYKDIVWYDEDSDEPVISCIYRNDYPHRVTEPDVDYLQDYYVLTEDGFKKAPFKLVESPSVSDIDKYYELDDDGEYVLTDDTGIVIDKDYYTKTLNDSTTYYSYKIYVMQYDTTNIPYYVFNPLTSLSNVTHTADGISSTQTLTTTAGSWAYKTAVAGTHTLVISCGDSSIEITLEVKHLDVNIEPVTANLAFDFNPVGLSNNSADRLWHDENTNVAMTVSNNFDWSNGGYKLDADGNQYFCIKSGTTATFDYNLFESDAKIYGSEFKIIFRTTNVKKADATFLNCVGDSVGLKMNTHEAYLYSSGGNLYIPYSEEDKIEFEFNINPLDQENEDATAVIMSYEDGVGMRPMIYDNSHRLNQQQNVKPLTFGSEYCDIHIYRMKAYTSSLTDSNILANFIADAPDASEMIARYNRNQIYDENNNLTPEALAEACPDLRIIKIECPQFTNNKSNFVKYTNVQCIYKNGDPVLDNWTFTNAYHSGQGTTSNEYGYSGRNIDIICCLDGVNQYSSKITFDPDYKTTLTLGDGSKYYNGTGKVSLSRTSVPNNWFNIKVNIASSENANNALLQKRYNDYLPYTSRAKQRDPFAKNSMEFFNCVVFVKETGNANGTSVARREFTDSEWHYYALGNIGDSKKTDATRVNDPDDMKEFCIEISDNTLPNAAFHTGVYDVDGEISYDPEDGGKMVYPITEAQWNNANNVKRLNLAYSFDGDETDVYPASFEFRYDMGGETRDGDTTGLSSAEQDAQRERNKQIFRDFYKWVVTSTDQNFVSQLNGWFIQESALYWYLFTERYTMIDNRAKNSFWHFGDTGEYRVVPTPNSMFMDYYYELDEDGETYTLTEDEAVDSDKTYYWRYAFEMWDYDNDTALGINNSGELTMTYGKEDTDYRTDGQPSSGYIFNAAESTFWQRIRDLMGSQLSALYQSLDSANCWSSDSLINQWDAWQNQFPEEIWRLDIERKYYRTYRGEGLNAGNTPEPTPRYLQEMMNGRKRYQRRQFERDQEAYMGTKYLSSSIMANKIEFRCNTPIEAVVSPDYDLTIVPYSDMYLSVKFGNTNPVQIRAKAGEEYTVECPIVGNMDDTMFVIYCASRIQALNDISACYIHDNDFSSASKLQTLVIGNTTPGYQNSFLTTLNLGSNPLLESLDIRNCPNLSGSLNLSSCVNLETLLAEGTALAAVTFANYGKISTAHLPDTINTLVMRNLQYLTDLDVSVDNLESLTIENSIVDEYEMVNDALETLQTLRLVGIDWTLADTTLLNQIHAMYSSYLAGEVYISGQVRQQELIRYSTSWNDLSVSYNPNNLVTQYLVTYVNADGSTLYETYVDRGDTPIDPVEEGLIDTPTMTPTAQYSYTYSGWDDVETVILSDKTITATYTATTRTYTVTWYSRAGLSLGSTTAAYGSEVVYNGATPTNTSEESTYVYNLFAGWDKSTGYITGDLDVYAIWQRAELPAVGTDLSTMTPAQVFAVASAGSASTFFVDKDYIDITLGEDFSFSNVDSRVLATNLVLDGTNYVDTGIKLFDANERSFTLAIDFQFAAHSADATLLSCFEFDGSEGFRLRSNGTHPNVQWGNTNIAIGSGKFRDMLVIRHQKGSEHLYLYYSNTTTDTERFSNLAYGTELVRSRATSTDNTLVLGAMKFPLENVYEDYATGTINWCKIWFDDLGETNAKALANWYHEKIRMEYYGTRRYTYSSGIRCAASFISNSLLEGRAHRMNDTNTNAGGWDECDMRSFLNSRVYKAFPTVWRSLIKQVNISASAGSQSHDILTSRDYIYLPAYGEVSTQTSSPYVNEGTAISWFTSNPTRCKFKGVIIPDDATYFTANTDPSALTTNAVEYGDVWIDTSASSVGKILVSRDEATRRNLTGVTNAAITSITASWFASVTWWGRSPYVGDSAYFMIVSNYGNPYGGYYASYAFGVCPCFSI